MKRSLLSLAAVAALVASLPAQTCPSGVQLTPYGQGCYFTMVGPPTISGSFDAAACSLNLTIDAQQTCCNILVAGRFLIVGAQQASIPFPLGVNCTILASLDVIVPLPGGAGGVGLDIPLSPALIGATAFAQGVVDRFTTIGFTHDFEFTAGLSVSPF